MTISEDFKVKFETNIDSTEPDGCFPWTAGTSAAGYGVIRLNGKIEYAHRIAYEKSNGKIPPGMVVRHSISCTTRACVNPDHLTVGTQADNMRDRDLAGTTAKGESSGMSKLKNNDVKQIRLRAKHGETQSSIAKYFNVSQTTVGNIINRNTWKHLP